MRQNNLKNIVRPKSGVRCWRRGLPSGQVVDETTGALRLYYGAADSSIAVAHGNINEMLDWLMGR